MSWQAGTTLEEETSELMTINRDLVTYAGRYVRTGWGGQSYKKFLRVVLLRYETQPESNKKFRDFNMKFTAAQI